MEPLSKTDAKPLSKTDAKPIEKRIVICNGPIYHQGGDYVEGDEIELSDPLLSLWLESGTVREKA
jgi:hypothetical protein